MMQPLIISFYTNDWEYPAHAERLQKECDDLKINHHIKELESTGSYRDNCRKKPFFILECLEKLQQPVLWLDVDASILKYPAALLNKDSLDYDLAAVRKKTQLNHWYVGSMWFNNTPGAKNILARWCESTTPGSADDGVFQAVYAEYKDSVKILELDPSIHTVMMQGRRQINHDTCFAHRISRGESKSLEKQMSKKIKAAKKSNVG